MSNRNRGVSKRGRPSEDPEVPLAGTVHTPLTDESSPVFSQLLKICEELVRNQARILELMRNATEVKDKQSLACDARNCLLLLQTILPVIALPSNIGLDNTE